MQDRITVFSPNLFQDVTDLCNYKFRDLGGVESIPSNTDLNNKLKNFDYNDYVEVWSNTSGAQNIFGITVEFDESLVGQLLAVSFGFGVIRDDASGTISAVVKFVLNPKLVLDQEFTGRWPAASEGSRIFPLVNTGKTAYYPAFIRMFFVPTVATTAEGTPFHIRFYQKAAGRMGWALGMLRFYKVNVKNWSKLW